MKHGFIKVAAAVPTLKVGDVAYNVQQIETLIAQAEGKGVEVIVFPELSLTGYTCQDLFTQSVLIDASETGIMTLLDLTRQLDIISIVGLPVIVGDLLLNCAAVIQRGQLLGIVPKTYLPNYGEFYEKRWFASSQDLRPTEIRFAGNVVTVSPDPQLFRTCDGVMFG
ncbi:MAG: NAD(+) synthase, partial [Prevotella sp.]|nr:NAD(+) synthase [Prevotella sp.]